MPAGAGSVGNFRGFGRSIEVRLIKFWADNCRVFWVFYGQCCVVLCCISVVLCCISVVLMVVNVGSSR